MLIMIKSSRITYLSICFGAKIHKFMAYQRQIHYSTDLSTQRKTTAKTDKFEKIRWIIMYVVGRILGSIFKISTFAMHNSYYF